MTGVLSDKWSHSYPGKENHMELKVEKGIKHFKVA